MTSHQGKNNQAPKEKRLVQSIMISIGCHGIDEGGWFLWMLTEQAVLK
jgi:hypothetical protein